MAESCPVNFDLSRENIAIFKSTIGNNAVQRICRTPYKRRSIVFENDPKLKWDEVHFSVNSAELGAHIEESWIFGFDESACLPISPSMRKALAKEHVIDDDYELNIEVRRYCSIFFELEEDKARAITSAEFRYNTGDNGDWELFDYFQYFHNMSSDDQKIMHRYGFSKHNAESVKNSPYCIEHDDLALICNGLVKLKLAVEQEVDKFVRALL